MSKAATRQKGWRSVTLGEITRHIGRGITPSYSDRGVTVINQRCIRDGKVLFAEAKKTDPEKRNITNEKYLQSLDIVICSTGVGTLGRVSQLGYINEKITADSHVTIVRGTDKINKLFLGWFLKSKEKMIENLAEGSTGQIELPRIKVHTLSVLLPPPQIQKAIAEVLSSLDDKIDLLHRQNKTLENIAQTLFRKWFIDEKDENRKRERIGDVLKTTLGGTPSTAKSEYWNGSIPWINSGEINKFRILEPTKYITKLGLEKSATELLPKGTTVIAITGATLGQVSLLEIDSCANQSVVGIIPNARIPREYVYLWITHIIDQLVSNQTGGAQQHINKNDVNNADIVIPPQSVTKEKVPIIKDFFDKVSKNLSQIQILEELHKTLLPKLMSGAVRIKS